MDFRPFRRRFGRAWEMMPYGLSSCKAPNDFAQRVGSEINESGNRNPVGRGSTTEGGPSTCMTGELGLTCVLAGENAAG